MEKKLSSINAGKFFLAVVLTNISLQFVASVLMLLGGWTSGESYKVFNLIFMVVLQLGNIAVTVAFTKKTQSVKEHFAPVKAWTIVLSVLVAVVCLFSFVWSANLFAFGLESIGYTFMDAFTFDTPFAIVWGGISVCVLAPVVEEIVFRGVMLDALKQKFGRVACVLLSGLAFSLMHMNPEQTVYQFLLGCACAYLALCSRSVITAIVIHATSNAIAFAGSLFDSAYTIDIIVVVILAVVMTVVGAAVIFFIGKGVKKIQNGVACAQNKEVSGEEEMQLTTDAKGSVIAYYLAGVGVSLFMWIMVFVSAVMGVG